MVPITDEILTFSKYSRQALLQFAAAARWAMPRVDVIRLGGGWSPLPEARRPKPPGGTSTAWKGPPGPYVLFVSTIEIRKNHRLLVRTRLIDRHGAGPDLRRAGRLDGR